MKNPPTPLNTHEIYFQASPLPYIKPFSAPVPTPPISNAMLNAVHKTDAVQATITLRTTVGALPEDSKEFDLIPAVPPSISAPLHPVPFVQLFGPNKTPRILFNTRHNEFLTMTIPGLSWTNTEATYNTLRSEHMRITQTEHPNWFA
jgi:hypothetical protein